MNSWLYKTILADASHYLQSLGIAPEIIQWITTQPNAQFFVNEIRKNPTLQLSDLQQLIPQQKHQFDTEDMKFVTNKRWQDPFRTWVLVQLRKLRTRDKNLPDYHTRDFPLIYDWYTDPDENVDIASYSFEQAMEAQIDWHERMAGRGAGIEFHKTNPQLIMYGPEWKNPEFNGWTIQKVISKNDLLAEGNKMNHCTGKDAYCKAIEAGNIDIFSLRDPINEPHVTIEIDNEGYIKQVMGNSNHEPDDEYKAMIKEWFGVYQNDRTLHSDLEPYAFEFSNDSTIDDEINHAVETLGGDEWGITAPLSVLDIQQAYDNALSEISGRFGTGVMYVGQIGPALANAAWQADKYRYSLVGTGEYTPERFQVFSNRYGVGWLHSTIEHDNNKLFENQEPYDPGYSVEDIANDYPELDEDELQEKYWEILSEEEGEYYRKYMSETLPYALNDAIMDALNSLEKTDPFLPQHTQQKQELIASKKWNYIYSQKAMPLPDFGKDLNFTKRIQYPGIGNIDQKMTQETADELQQHHSPEFLGAGNQGIAFVDPLEPNAVRKITDDPNEAEVAKKQLKKDYPFLVNIFAVKQLQPNLWLIKSEKIQILKRVDYDAIYSLLRRTVQEQGKGQNFSNIPDNYSKVRNSLILDYPNNVHLMDKYVKMISRMNEANFYTSDPGPKNVGINSVGDMVLLDFGHSRAK